LLAKIGTFNRNLDRLTENYSLGAITEESYEQNMKKLQKEVLALKEKISPPEAGN
jgi:phage host-nuclease inhibitor protein Gam